MAAREEAMVPAVRWEGGRFPQEATLLKIMEKHRLLVRQAAPAILVAVAGGLVEITVSAGSLAEAVPAMWTVSHLSPTMGNITLRKQRQG